MNINYLDLAIANEQIKTTDIKGKPYMEVNQRIKAFRMVYPQGYIDTEIVSNENGTIVMSADVGFYKEVYLDDGKNFFRKVSLGTGTAYEKENSTFINKTSYIENCETSAIGRALGMAGFGIDVSVASAEEVQNAINNQTISKEDAEEYKINFGKYSGKTIKEIYEEKPEYVEWLMNNTKDETIVKVIEIVTGLVKPSEEELDNRTWLLASIQTLEMEKNVDHNKALKHYKVNSDKEMTIEQLEDYEKRLKEMK